MFGISLPQRPCCSYLFHVDRQSERTFQFSHLASIDLQTKASLFFSAQFTPKALFFLLSFNSSLPLIFPALTEARERGLWHATHASSVSNGPDGDA